MTLITRLNLKNRIIIASDDRISDIYGLKKEKTGKKITLIDKHKIAIGVAGFYSFAKTKKDTEHKVSWYISKLARKNFNTSKEFIDNLIITMTNTKCEDFNSTTSVFLIANYSGVINKNEAILKMKDEIPVVTPILNNTGSKLRFPDIYISDLWKLLQSRQLIRPSILNRDRLKKLINFNFDYIASDNDNVSTPEFILCAFHVVAVSHFNCNDYYDELDNMNNVEVISLIRLFYDLVSKSKTLNILCSHNHEKIYKQLLTIGNCNQIACVDSQEAKFIFEV